MTKYFDMNNKVVSISNWYFLFHCLFRLCIFLTLFLIVATALAVAYPNNDKIALQIGALFSIVITALFVANDVMYWKQSGIYVHDDGDHVVKIGGFFAKESKLLNGTIIANEVTRNPIDQLLGMGSISTGLFGNKKLAGVRYKEIEHYDDLMRSGSEERFSTMF